MYELDIIVQGTHDNGASGNALYTRMAYNIPCVRSVGAVVCSVHIPNRDIKIGARVEAPFAAGMA